MAMDFGWGLFNINGVVDISNVSIVGVKDGVKLRKKEEEKGKIGSILNFLSKII